MAFSVCIPDRREGVGDLAEAGEHLADFLGSLGVLSYAFRMILISLRRSWSSFGISTACG